VFPVSSSLRGYSTLPAASRDALFSRCDGPLESSTVGLGGQIGYIFPVNQQVQGFLGLKCYADLSTENRLKGWSAGVTLAFSPSPPKAMSQ
jgi:hypothetical protein